MYSVRKNAAKVKIRVNYWQNRIELVVDVKTDSLHNTLIRINSHAYVKRFTLFELSIYFRKSRSPLI